MKTLRYILATLIIVAAGTPALSQSAADSTKPPKQFKNVVRYNLSGPLLFGFDYLVFGYERVLKSNQTMSMNIGQAVLPTIVDFSSDDATLTGSSNNTGINFSLDYRFYLKKENKYGAPHGVYIGPYYSFNRFRRDSEWKLDDAAGTTAATADTKIDINTIGAELGYQFALGKRFTLDFVMIGPGFANYKLNSALAGTLTAEQKEKLLNAIQEVVTEKFPGMDFVLEDATINSQGNLNTWNIGFRYIMHIGFRF